MMLNQSKDVLDRRMEEVENITRQLSLDQELNYVLNQQVDVDHYDVYALWKSWRNTAAYSLTNTFLEDFYIYLNNYHAILHHPVCMCAQMITSTCIITRM